MLAVGDCRAVLARWGAEGVRAQCCVTSPPYWGLRDYGCEGQLELESTPEEYVTHLVEVFGLVREVLADDGVLWLNLGDSYAANRAYQVPDSKHVDVGNHRGASVPVGLKPKDLVGMPWRVALALQADGWYLRCDVIWAKPNPMPESVTDRPTKAHEYLFLLAKSERYYYDWAAIQEPAISAGEARGGGHKVSAGNAHYPPGAARQHLDVYGVTAPWRNRRSVWTIATQPYAEAHFATFPEDLVKPCILAGTRPGDTVLDPFMGSGTVAQDLGRRWLGCELNPAYAALCEHRTRQQGLVLRA